MIRDLFFTIVCSFLIGIAAITAGAQGTEFTYQGGLKDGTDPANGPYDLEFALFDALSAGTQLGTTQARNGVTVTNGIFSVSLDFGTQFPGADRFLEVRVRQTGGGAFTPLTPRQLVMSVPYSVKSLNTDNAVNAANATNATQLNGQAASFYQNASNLSSGTLPGPRLSGTYTGALTFSNATNVFAGSGSGLTALNATNLATGTLADARLTANIPRLNAANAFGNVTNTFAGNVGIGNTNPGSLLHVGSAYTPTFGGVVARFGGAVAVNGTVASDQGTILSRSEVDGGAASLVLDAEADLGGSTWFINSNSNLSPFGSPGGSLTFDNGAAAMIITSSGNVGIGTTAPARRLHVANGQLGAISPHSNTSLVLERNANNYLQMYAPDANESGLLFGKPSQDIRAAVIADVNDSLQFRTGGNTTRVTISGTGDVGIGTAAPAAKLEVQDGVILSSGSVGRLSALNPSNQSASVSLDWINDGGTDIARIRYGGNGAGSTSGFAIQGPSDITKLKITNSGGLVVGTPGGLTSDLTVNGKIVFNQFGAATSSGLCYNNAPGGGLGITICLLSSIRYKTNIRNFTGGLDLVNKLRPVNFDWKSNGEHDVGFIAEEVAEVEPLLATHTSKGEVQGVKYDRFGVVLVNAVKEQQAQIEALEDQNRTQQKLLEQQQGQIGSLMKLICPLNPGADVCKQP